MNLDPQASLTFSFFTVDGGRKSYEGVERQELLRRLYRQNTDLNLSSLIAHPKRVNIGKNRRCRLLTLGSVNVDLELGNTANRGTGKIFVTLT